MKEKSLDDIIPWKPTINYMLNRRDKRENENGFAKGRRYYELSCQQITDCSIQLGAKKMNFCR